MKVVFVSNYINHHQIPFCNAMYKLVKGQFAFIQTEPMEEERIRMGWKEENEIPYLYKYYENPTECAEMIKTAQIAIFGGTDEESYIQERLLQKSPVIRYSERLYKTGQWKAISPRGLKKKYHDHTRYRKQEVYLLCSGAYVPSDFHIVRAYPEKMMRWGYFPQMRKYENVDELMRGKIPGTILWAARFLDWKHVEMPLMTAKWLKEKGYRFHMDIIGGGEQQQEAQRMFEEYGLAEVVTLQGFQTPDTVRGFMEKADIFLVTSDRNEGWGAVVNEAMNSGCAVVANHMIGAVPYLLQNGENGYVYCDGNEEQLFVYTERLLKDRELCERLGRAALQTITEQWNETEAATRLVTFCLKKGFLRSEDVERNEKIENYLKSGESCFKDGPCSKAPILSERRQYKKYGKTID